MICRRCGANDIVPCTASDEEILSWQCPRCGFSPYEEHYGVPYESIIGARERNKPVSIFVVTHTEVFEVEARDERDATSRAQEYGRPFAEDWNCERLDEEAVNERDQSHHEESR